ncbi:MAG: hypothetical protein A2857_06830 [Candidatus Levybacteria bacterium RIFCSPHIGHO2_01_FULL_36_15]|nr:MAG: hypothetical protein A2857_06830 [Candidatus Levybacteria bacterium RIFCSPHIGHO2_01_FULL_36_15]OGH37808.1 MAG: hypothetical protein A2905_00155 [Candidatus Levybacteria bacterium RIFCSPLOWO2_01_FULL_36_10]
MRIKKYITLLTIVCLFFVNILSVNAEDVILSAPTAPSAVSAPSAPSVPSAPSDPAPAPSAPTAPSSTPPASDSTSDNNSTTSPAETSAPHDQTQQTQSQTNNSTVPEGAVGDIAVKTGNVTNTGVLTTVTNTNTNGNQTAGSDSNTPGGNNSSGVQAANSENGSFSTNSALADSTSNSSTVQQNAADISNNLNKSSVTGGNTASGNVGNSFISSGNANISGTIITAANTNLSGVSVSEFNVVDDQKGNLVLDYGANCISGCANGTVSAGNVANGSDSTNTAESSNITNNNTFQSNDGTVENTLILMADSGKNDSSKNTGGDSVVQTGDANVSGNALTFLNNNITGNVAVGVVNVYGNLTGDIVLPASSFDSCGNCSGTSTNTSAQNSANGSFSSNSANASTSATDTTLQNNEANIQNNLNLLATTGDNNTSANTGGDSVVKTGSATVDAQTLNVANSNIDGGNIWLVIVNKAGQWIGQIVGSPAGSSYAASAGTQFSVNGNGDVTAVNSGNSSGSENNASSSQSDSNTVSQTNNAKINNNINLSASTGENSANDNTGGTSYIQTGDAHVIASLVNFVNNNITGGGKLLVTVVNVFGSWVGDFLPPGATKDTNTSSTDSSSQNSDTADNTVSSTNESQNNSTGKSSNQPSSNFVASESKNNASSILFNPVNTNNTSGSKNSLVYNAAPNSYVAVAGIKSADFGAAKIQSKTKNIKINLAWLIVIIPLVYLLFLLKTKFIPVLQIFKKKVSLFL